MDIEVCAFSLNDCLIAQQAGATRVELCGGMLEGGTTPSVGLIALARKALFIKLYVMIRPRGGDFCYSETEFEVMKNDIIFAKNLAVDGVVLGILLPNGKVDEARTQALVNLAKPLGVTFHRAFDMTNDAFEALNAIIACGCERILTSGQENKVIDGKKLIAELVKKAQNKIQIMAGSGVNAKNAQELSETGIDALHLTGKIAKNSKMIYRNETLKMANNSSNEFENFEADFTEINNVVLQFNTIF